MIREEQPTGGDDVCGGGEGSGDWARATAAERASAAGPAPAASDMAATSRLAASYAGGEGVQVNPAGYPWVQQNFVPCTKEGDLRAKWKDWWGKPVFGSEETVERKQLDAWPGFAYDILERKAEEF